MSKNHKQELVVRPLIKELSNGLPVLGEYNGFNKSAALGFFVKTGARDESEREAGVSHFLEHMVFKGGSKFSAMDITYDLGNIGAQANAYTSEESTVFYGGIIPEYVERFQEILCDLVQPGLDREEFETEKKVILEEIALYQDRPQFYFFEKAQADYFAGHPAGNSVLGSTESITRLTRDEMMHYLKRRYSPSNMALVASGNFDWSTFVKNADNFCGTWSDFEAARETPDFLYKAVQENYTKKGINQAHVLLMAPGCSIQAEERYALSLLAMIIGDYSGSRMYWELIDNGLVDSAGADNDDKDGIGAFYAYAAFDPANLSQVMKIMKDILASPLDFTEEDLERARTKLLSRVVLGGELPMARLMSIGNQWLYHREVRTLEEQMEKYRAVTKKDIEDALKIYPFKDWSEFTLLPE